jgi:hypothetical protein
MPKRLKSEKIGFRSHSYRGCGLFAFLWALSGCSITAVRPAQEMSNMEVAIRAAKEVNADVLAPELFRMAQEAGMKARRDYKLKNFKEARDLADQARTFAEKAEFTSIQSGGKRDVIPEDPLASPSYPLETISPKSPGEPPATAPAPGQAPAPGNSGANP